MVFAVYLTVYRLRKRLILPLICYLNIRWRTKDEVKRIFAFATSGTQFFSRYILWPNRWSCHRFFPWSRPGHFFKWIILKICCWIHFENVKYFYIDVSMIRIDVSMIFNFFLIANQMQSIFWIFKYTSL